MTQKELNYIKDSFSQIIDDIAGNPDWHEAARAVASDLGTLERELREKVASLPSDLDEAAWVYVKKKYGIGEPEKVFENEEIAEDFKAGAEWGEKSVHKAIMKKADEVRDKRFDTDYEVKIEPAAGFDLGCINVYHEGKLVGQYVEPKEEKKLPEGLDEAAKEYAKQYYVSGGYSPFPNIEITACECAFKAGADWMAKQMPMPEDTVLFNKGVEEGKRLMMEDAVDGEVIEAGNFIKFQDGTFIDLNPTEREPCFKFQDGDKVKVIIVKEDEQ